jgi:hypothetical protein
MQSGIPYSVSLAFTDGPANFETASCKPNSLKTNFEAQKKDSLLKDVMHGGHTQSASGKKRIIAVSRT